MSTEWYARTDKRHIQDTFGDINTKAPTLAQRFKRNRAKYITTALAVILAIVLFVLAFPVMFPKNTADYTVTLVTQQTWDANIKQEMLNELAKAGHDRNSDGKVEIRLRELVISDTQTGERNIALEQLMTTLTNDQYTLLAMEPQIYERYVKNYAADSSALFEPIANGNADNLRAWDKTPALLFGIRALKAENEEQTAHRELLNNFFF